MENKDTVILSDGILTYPGGHADGAGRRAWRWALRGADLVVALGGTVLLTLAIAPFLHLFWPLAALAENFALQILAGACLLGALALACGRRRWFIANLCVALVQVATIHPYWPVLLHIPVTPPATELKVVSLNVWARSDSYDAVGKYLLESDADVVGLVETSPRWQAALAGLQTRYPYRVACPQKTPCEQILLSRHPIARQGVTRIDGTSAYLSWAEIAVAGPGGPRNVTFALTHLIRPFNPGPADRAGLPDGVPNLTQAIEAERLAAHLRPLGNDLVLMGDFNAAPWSRIQQRLRRDTGLDNAGSLAPSWPSWNPAFLRLPIDHVLARGALHIGHIEPGPAVGSDHLPVAAWIDVTE
jgi:endonuclease/exonuclease/phosphatase (EEP) superfamily protein YafD